MLAPKSGMTGYSAPGHLCFGVYETVMVCQRLRYEMTSEKIGNICNGPIPYNAIVLVDLYTLS